MLWTVYVIFAGSTPGSTEERISEDAKSGGCDIAYWSTNIHPKIILRNDIDAKRGPADCPTRAVRNGKGQIIRPAGIAIIPVRDEAKIYLLLRKEGDGQNTISKYLTAFRAASYRIDNRPGVETAVGDKGTEACPTDKAEFVVTAGWVKVGGGRMLRLNVVLDV